MYPLFHIKSGLIFSIFPRLARFSEKKATLKTRFLEEKPPLSHKTNNDVQFFLVRYIVGTHI